VLEDKFVVGMGIIAATIIVPIFTKARFLETLIYPQVILIMLDTSVLCRILLIKMYGEQ
jgi:hypothetical protein